LVTSNLVPKSTAELPDFKEIFAQYMANGDVVRNEDGDRGPSASRRASARAFNGRGCFTPQDKLVHDYDLWILDRVVRQCRPVMPGSDA